MEDQKWFMGDHMSASVSFHAGGPAGSGITSELGASWDAYLTGIVLKAYVFQPTNKKDMEKVG